MTSFPIPRRNTTATPPWRLSRPSSPWDIASRSTSRQCLGNNCPDTVPGLGRTRPNVQQPVHRNRNGAVARIKNQLRPRSAPVVTESLSAIRAWHCHFCLALGRALGSNCCGDQPDREIDRLGQGSSGRSRVENVSAGAWTAGGPRLRSRLDPDRAVNPPAFASRNLAKVRAAVPGEDGPQE